MFIKKKNSTGNKKDVKYLLTSGQYILFHNTIDKQEVERLAEMLDTLTPSAIHIMNVFLNLPNNYSLCYERIAKLANTTRTMSTKTVQRAIRQLESIEFMGEPILKVKDHHYKNKRGITRARFVFGTMDDIHKIKVIVDLLKIYKKKFSKASEFIYDAASKTQIKRTSTNKATEQSLSIQAIIYSKRSNKLIGIQPTENQFSIKDRLLDQKTRNINRPFAKQYKKIQFEKSESENATKNSGQVPKNMQLNQVCIEILAEQTAVPHEIALKALNDAAKFYHLKGWYLKNIMQKIFTNAVETCKRWKNYEPKFKGDRFFFLDDKFEHSIAKMQERMEKKIKAGQLCGMRVTDVLLGDSEPEFEHITAHKAIGDLSSRILSNIAKTDG